MISLNLDVLVSGSTVAIRAAMRVTRTLPLVIAGVGDPVRTGLVASLAHPGGNVTGVAGLSPELSAKRLALLKEMLPKLLHVAVLWNPANPSNVVSWTETQQVARELGLRLRSLEVREARDFDKALAAAQRSEAVIVLRDPLINRHAARLADWAAKSRLPVMYPSREYAATGGLIAYGISSADLVRRSASYVDKILKGAKPGDLPVEQPTRFELVVNMRTARSLGLTIPLSVRLRADHIID